MEIEIKDIAVLSTALVALILGVWNLGANYYTTKRTSFINNITSQRIKWLEQLRQDISVFCGLTHTLCSTEIKDEKQAIEILKELDRLRYLIYLRLNPAVEPDVSIAQLLQEIPNLSDNVFQEKRKAALEKLLTLTQKLLKQEWERVKAESKDGDLSHESKLRQLQACISKWLKEKSTFLQQKT